jgi:uncharacterized protein (TIGR02145 family)
MGEKIFTILAAVLITINGFAQAPEKISYQAVIQNNNGQLIIHQKVGMQISILQGSTISTEVYVETQNPITNANGLVSIEIGGGTIVSGSFATIDWANGPYFIKTEIDPDGGTNYTIIGKHQLLSVPYALYAKTAKTVTNPITENQNLSDVISINNAANGQIKNVTDPTDAQDAATKAYVDALKNKIYDELLAAGLNGVVSDIDGNIYKTIKIGSQIWMAENLKTTQNNDGTAIPLVTDNTAWRYLATPGYSWYNNDSAMYAQMYGALYNWYTVETGNLCPTGWHVPSDAEWTTLTDYLGGAGIAGDKLKETGTVHWESPNAGATDETGFTALPGGMRFYNGSFFHISNFGYWWSATRYSPKNAWSRNIGSDFSEVFRYYYYNLQYGLSVRCVKD